MKRPSKSDAAQSKGKVKKRSEEKSAPTLSRKLRDKKDGETSKQGVQPRQDQSPHGDTHAAREGLVL